MNEDDSTPQSAMENPLTPPPPIPPKEVSITRIADLQRMNIDQLNKFAKNMGLTHTGSMTKSQMVFEIVKKKSSSPGEVLVAEGVLEVLPDGFGFLRSPNYNYFSSAEDIYVSPAQIRRFDLKKGDTILFGKYAGTEIEIGGEEHIIMREDDILGVLEG